MGKVIEPVSETSRLVTLTPYVFDSIKEAERVQHIGPFLLRLAPAEGSTKSHYALCVGNRVNEGWIWDYAKDTRDVSGMFSSTFIPRSAGAEPDFPFPKWPPTSLSAAGEPRFRVAGLS